MSDNNIDIVEAELWDHYSELPNPAWYQYKQENPDDNIDDDIDNVSEPGPGVI